MNDDFLQQDKQPALFAKRGKIRVTGKLVHENTADLIAAMAGKLAINVAYEPVNDIYWFTCIGEAFEAVPEGSDTPTCIVDDKGIIHYWTP